MKKRIAILVLILAIAALAAAAGGDEIKWTKSKELVFAPPATDIATYTNNVNDVRGKYHMEWAPITSNDIDVVQADYEGWDTFATEVNANSKRGGLTAAEAAEKTKLQRDLQTKFITFVITVYAANERYYKTVTRDYWTFRLITDKGTYEPLEVGFRNLMESEYYHSFVRPGIFEIKETDPCYENEYRITFENPFEGNNPRSLKLTMEGGDVKRGFEWRFKQPK